MFAGCDQKSDFDAEIEQRTRASWDVYDRQDRRVDEQLAKGDEQSRRWDEQSRSFESLLEKWEEQARRYDAILDAMEKQQGIKK